MGDPDEFQTGHAARPTLMAYSFNLLSSRRRVEMDGMEIFSLV